jgi:hypothetical protein
MFDKADSGVALVDAWVDELSDLDGADLADAQRIALLTALEELKSATAAAQARVTVAFDTSQRAECVTETEERQCRLSVAAQVALARRESPHAGNRHLGVARALVAEMPHTMAALASGLISEWRAHLMVRETATLTLEDRAAVDAELAGRLPPWATGRSRPRRVRSATDSTRRRSCDAPAAPRATGGSACGPRPTR